MVQALLEKLGTDHHQVDVVQDGIIQANKRWKNVGGAGNRDVMAAYGTGTTPETFHQEFFGMAEAYCEAGAEVTTAVNCLVPLDATPGLKNALVSVGKYDAINVRFIADDYEIVPDAINVISAGPTEPSGEEISVTFIAV